ncbi:MAG: metallophosphoesterase [Acidimicrobiales bacterium]
MVDKPSRPASVTDPRQLGFTRQRHMVPWLSPSQLLRTALQVVVSAQFGSYSDKRELEANLGAGSPPSYADQPELWLDYVADLGDAFEPTYTMASLLAAATLDLAVPGEAPVTTPRGRLLVMGGDEVYPVASVRRYQDQTVGPYRAALPYVDDEASAPHLYAIPGNHDWYDGLTAFLRTFCGGQWIGGWRTRQSRSYFALALPHRWWLWAVDFQFDSYMDEPQYRYFADTVAPLMHAGDSVILCTPTPTWVYANQEESEEAYVTVDYLERTLIRDGIGADVRLYLSGDAHHYARYAQVPGSAADAPAVAEPGQRITAGGGGAFLSPTHNLPSTLVLPPEASRDPGKSAPPTSWALQGSTYPSTATSGDLCRRVWRLPLENVGMWALIAGLAVLLAWVGQVSVPGGLHARPGYWSLAWHAVRHPIGLALSLAVVLALLAFTGTHVAAKRYGLGLPHAVVQVAAILAVIWASAEAWGWVSAGWLFGALLVLTAAAVGGLVGCEIMAAYLWVANHWGLNDNELFAAQRNRDWKNFLRLHVDTGGVLTVYPVGVDHTPRRWERRDDGGPGDPWLQPAGEAISFHLIEAPVRIDPAIPPPAPPARAARAARPVRKPRAPRS